MNNNYIKSSLVAVDYAKCSNKLSDVLYNKEKKGPGFSVNLSSQQTASKYTLVVELFYNMTTKNPVYPYKISLIRWFIDF